MLAPYNIRGKLDDALIRNMRVIFQNSSFGPRRSETAGLIETIYKIKYSQSPAACFCNLHYSPISSGGRVTAPDVACRSNIDARPTAPACSV